MLFYVGPKEMPVKQASVNDASVLIGSAGDEDTNDNQEALMARLLDERIVSV